MGENETSEKAVAAIDRLYTNLGPERFRAWLWQQGITDETARLFMAQAEDRNGKEVET